MTYCSARLSRNWAGSYHVVRHRSGARAWGPPGWNYVLNLSYSWISTIWSITVKKQDIVLPCGIYMTAASCKQTSNSLTPSSEDILIRLVEYLKLKGSLRRCRKNIHSDIKSSLEKTVMSNISLSIRSCLHNVHYPPNHLQVVPHCTFMSTDVHSSISVAVVGSKTSIAQKPWNCQNYLEKIQMSMMSFFLPDSRLKH